jgi:hypothetical protein
MGLVAVRKLEGDMCGLVELADHIDFHWSTKILELKMFLLLEV